MKAKAHLYQEIVKIFNNWVTQALTIRRVPEALRVPAVGGGGAAGSGEPSAGRTECPEREVHNVPRAEILPAGMEAFPYFNNWP